MQYLMLVYANESGFLNLTPEQQAAGVQAYGQFTQEMKDNGKLLQHNRGVFHKHRIGEFGLRRQ